MPRFRRSRCSWGLALSGHRISLLVLAVLLVSSPSRAVAQVCSDCTIELERVVSLGGGEDGWVGATYNVVRGTRYYYVAGATAQSDEIHVFDLAGNFVRTVGRRGQGPGEYGWIRALRIAPGDTLHVFDIRNARHTVLAPDFTVARTRKIDGEVFDGGALWLGGGSFVLNAAMPTANGIGMPLHILDHEGGIARSFGSDGALPELHASPTALRRIMAPAHDGGVWTLHPGEYRIERWNTAGEMVAELRIEAEWMSREQPRARVDGARPGPPPPGLFSIREDDDGLLWITGRVPAPNWEQAVDERRVTDWNGWAHTVIEVIDPGTSTRIARRTVPSFIGLFVPDADLLYTYREGEDGVPILDFWRVGLSPRRR